MNKIKFNCKPGVWVLLALTALVFSAYPSHAFEYEHKVKRTFPLTPDKSFQLLTVRGSVEIHTHNKNEVKIDAQLLSNNKLTRTEKHVKFESTANGLKVSSSGLIGSRANVRYNIWVPEFLHSVYVVTKNGKIKARGRYKDIRLSTGSGDIDFRGGFVRGIVQSANGDIEIYVRKLLEGDLTVDSANGSIWITLQKGSEFVIDGKTLTGSIRSDFQSTQTEKAMGRTITGSIGSGAHKVIIKAVNGDITLRRK